MLVRTRNISDYFAKIDHALDVADKKKSFDSGMLIANEIIGLLGIERVSADLKSFPRLKSNPSWTKNAPDYEDRKASYVLAENNDRNLDLKLFWVNKPVKRIISNLVTLTPNFEDETFYANKSIGIDFVLSENADHVIVVLSNNYKIRVLEVHKRLSNTQKKIFEKWAQDFNFNNKAQVHRVLWDSFDIQPLNKEFYVEISGLFNDLVQHLEKNKILDKKHRSQFVSRLIGRIIFCWFLRKKEIVSEDVGYFDAQGRLATEYYQDKLETLFFKVLNTPIEERPIGIDDKTPFLNGGLFEPKENDLFGKDELSFPEDYFERFYKFLGHYNFTTDESTSDFQQVAIDPEMLGRIFENLLAEETEETGEQARKAKGAFYTPREIVDYMCRESLRAYVAEKIGDDGRKVEVLQILFDKKEHELDANILGKLGTYKSRIIEALDEIKIIDPACGSGAFPIGMLQIMLSIYERLDIRLDHYKTKLGIIKNNIFGVDIEPMAVEISRLRTWLSLVVDSVIKPTEKNKGIEELPNLDFKFVCANSLIALSQDEGLYDNKEMAEQMCAIRERYFKTGSLRIKDKMKKDFEGILKRNQSIFVSEKQKQLLSYHPFEADNVCEFFDSQFMFGVFEFDVVIANPPYVQIKQIPWSDRKIYDKIFKSAVGRFNLFYFFLEKSSKLVKQGGFSAFIVPDRLLLNTQCYELRNWLLNEQTVVEIDAFNESVFDSAVVDSIILFFKNKKSVYLNINVKDGVDLDSLYKINSTKVPIRYFIESPNCQFNLNYNPQLDQVIKTIRLNSIKLGEISEIKDGIIQSKIPDILFLKKAIDKDSKKLLFGKDIIRYKVSFNQNWVNYKPDEMMKVELKRGGGGLRLRKKEIFERPKILTRQTADQIIAAYDDENLYYSNTLHGTTVFDKQYDPLYVLGALNSTAITWYYRKTTAEGGKVFAQIKIEILNLIPIPRASLKDQKGIIDCVKKVFLITKDKDYLSNLEKQNKVQVYTKEINAMVLDLYGLTEEDKELINRSVD